MLSHCALIAEWCIVQNVEADEAKIRFNVRALIRLACNMVTDADPVSTV